MKLFQRWALALVALLASFAMAGAVCAATYVDTGLHDLKPEERLKISDPKPVQLLFEFKTKGSANARATKQLTKQVTDLVKASGLFSEVSDGPVAGGAVLSITIDNVPQEGAASAGFVTGLTFGLKGTVVTDYYVGDMTYLGADGGKATSQVKHALHTVIGMKSEPPNGVKAKNILEAVQTMVRQVVDNGLNGLASNVVLAGPADAPSPLQTAPTAEPATTPTGPEAPAAAASAAGAQ